MFDIANVREEPQTVITINSVGTTLISVFVSSDPGRLNFNVIYRKKCNPNRIFYTGNICEYAYIYTTVKTK